MPDNDERDPLDSWLDQQVQPLPPPPGTLELITRRARRRRLRKLAVTVASAAAVVAAAAIATPPLLSLHVTPTPVAGSAAAGQPSAASSGTQQPNGSAAKYTPTPSASSPGPLTEPSGPVPANFQPVSVTFVSQRVGWVIGQAGTPGTCSNPNPYVCTSIARTDDAGKTWHGGPAPSTTGPSGSKGVSGIRFLDGVHGWAFGPELWATHDAGHTWTQVNTHGQRVTFLETAGDRAFALWATCSGTSAEFAADCASYTLMTTIKSSDAWTPVGSATSDLANGGAATSAMIELTGTTGYLLAPDGTLYSGPLDGVWQRAGTAPCQPGPAQPNGLPTGALLALADASSLAVACDLHGNLQVYTSDGGTNWYAQPAGAWSGLPSVGTPTSLAAAPDGTLVLGTTSGIYVCPAGTSHWKQASVRSAPNGGFSYVGMTTKTQGVAVPAEASLHEIWMTVDGGLTWAAVTPITPGG